MKLSFKKGIVLCLICTMLLGMMGMETSAADITYVYDDVGTMYNLVNNFRQSGEGWYYDENNQKVAAQQLQPLYYDYNLEKIAMTRAAELVQSYSHTRPNGQDVSGMVFALGMHMSGENIAWGESYLGTADSIFTAWREEDQLYAGQGHRRNMLSTPIAYTSIGIGHVKANGTDYWVQVFGDGTGGGTREILGATATTNEPATSEEPTAPATEYKVLEGANAVWSKSNGGAFVIKTDGDFAKFTGIVLNGIVVDPSNYEAQAGSTIITIKQEYMNLLSAGNYVCRVNYIDGSVDVPFTVDTTTGTQNDAAGTQNTTDTQNNAAGAQSDAAAGTQNNTRSPQTGDSTTSMIVVFLMLAAVSGTAVCQISKKKVR